MADDITHRVIPAQRSSAQPWQIIRIELWEDSGRIIAFPACDPLVQRTDVAQTQIICDEMRGEVEALDESSLSDVALEEQMHQLRARIAAAVFNAYGPERRFTFKVFTQDGVELPAA